ncbi:MAG TPA: AmmeMemoRadiSam system protein B [Thermoplasmata archaeon]|nr:AmmeMemoRadiSam system protein B [Thermoplasmata archaeon]
MTDRSARTPAVAGQFYEGDGAALARQIESCFLDPRGPGELPPRHRSPARRLRAAVVPHAGYPFSGPIAAHAYLRIAAELPPATVLVLGVDHYGLGAGPSLSARDWETPLGPMRVDPDLVRALDHRPIRIDEEAQRREHSIEVQLPFLEYALPEPRFVALQVPFGPYDALVRAALVVRAAVQDRDVLLLASTDFSHYVPAATAERLDRLAIDAILARDPRLLYDTVVSNDISMCGIAPTTVLLAALAEEDLDARLLRWGHSGEAHPMRDVVGYAALALESPAPAPGVK